MPYQHGKWSRLQRLWFICRLDIFVSLQLCRVVFSSFNYPIHPFSPLSISYSLSHFFPFNLVFFPDPTRGQANILRDWYCGTGTGTAATNDNVKTFCRDSSSLSRLTAGEKYRELARTTLSRSARWYWYYVAWKPVGNFSTAGKMNLWHSTVKYM